MNISLWRKRDEALDALLSFHSSTPEFTRHLTFQGGGALHFIYSSPRYSTDLDFACPDLAVKYESDLSNILARPVRFATELVTPTIKTNFSGIGHVKLSYKLPTGLVVKTEIVGVPAFHSSPTSGKYSPLSVESPDELYADKIVASLIRMNTRSSLKPTDLFDLNWLSRNFRLFERSNLASLVKSKLESYRAGNVKIQDLAGAIVSHISRPDYLAILHGELSKNLLPDVLNSMRLDDSFIKEAERHFTNLS